MTQLAQDIRTDTTGSRRQRSSRFRNGGLDACRPNKIPELAVGPNTRQYMSESPSHIRQAFEKCVEAHAALMVVGNGCQKVAEELILAFRQSLTRLLMLLANHPETPCEVLVELSYEENAGVLRAIADHPNSPVPVLRFLSDHHEAEVRAGLIGNPHLPEDTLWKLAKDTSADVRYCVAETQSTPYAILQVLLSDENPYVCHRAQCTCDSKLESDVKRSLESMAAEDFLSRTISWPFFSA